MIDQQGRLWGKVSIIDVGAILILLVALAVVLF